MAVLQEIKVPLLSVNDTSLTVVEMAFSNGQYVNKGDLIMVFETSKTTYDVIAETGGYIQFDCKAGNEYEVNEVVAKIYTDAFEFNTGSLPETVISHQSPISAPATASAIASWQGQALFSEEARRLIDSSNTSRSLFAGKDFVSRADVEQMLGIAKKQPVTANGHTIIEKKKLNLPVDAQKIKIEKLTSGKKREIEYLSDVQSTGLTSTINTFIETGGLFSQINQSLKSLKNSILPLMVYETARLLKKYPLLNAYFADGTIAMYNEINIGFAIDIDKGLKVLKLPCTNEKSLQEVEAEILNQSGKYLDDTLDTNDLTDISFTITDLSAEGVAFFRPLVNRMNSAILGIAAIDKQLERCTVSITFDHRVTEGKPVAEFLKSLKERIESYRPDNSYRVHEIACSKCYTPLSQDLSDVGFLTCVTPDGRDGYICQRCFKGF